MIDAPARFAATQRINLPDRRKIDSEDDERQLVAGAIRAPENTLSVGTIVQGNMYDNSAWGELFDTLARMYEQGSYSGVDDFPILATELRSSGLWNDLGGDVGVGELSQACPHGDQAGYYARRVAEAYRRRSVKGFARELARQAVDPDADLSTISEWIADRSIELGLDPTRSFSRVPDEATVAAIQRARRQSFEVMSSAELSRQSAQIDYLIEDVLVDMQPAVAAGPSKAMKTSVSIEMALSLASAWKFLGEFWVPEPKRVLFLSAESGLPTIRATAQSICRSRGQNLADITNINWGTWVPQVSSKETLDILRYHIDRSGAEVVFLDPLYRAVDGQDQANLSLMGQQLATLSDSILEMNATPVMVHHVRRTSQNAIDRRPLELSDLSGAGMTEFFRQWLLINRREAFKPGEPHRLWLSVGGSAGHCGQWSVEIDDSRDDPEGPRGWSVFIQPEGEAQQQDARKREAGRQAATEAKEQASRDRDIEKVRDRFPRDTNEGWTKNQIRDAAGISGTRVGVTIAQLIRWNEIEECPVQRKTGVYDGYRWTSVVEDFK